MSRTSGCATSCSAHHQDSALHPTIVQLERAAGFERGDTPEMKLRTNSRRCSRRHRRRLRVCPRRRVATYSRWRSVRSEPAKSAAQEGGDIRGCCSTSSSSSAQNQPVFLVYEDVHWIDPSSRELLDRVVDRVAGLPVLLLITFRPEFAVAMDRPVARYDAHPQPPRPASGCDAGAAGRGRQGTPGAYHGRDHQAHRRRAAFHRGVDEGCRRSPSESRKRRRREAPATSRSALAVPATLQASLMARLDRLGLGPKTDGANRSCHWP